LVPWLANLESSTRAPDTASCAGGTGKKESFVIILIGKPFLVRWERINPRKPFLPCGLHGSVSGAFDARVTDTASSPPVRFGPNGRETLWFYYWADRLFMEIGTFPGAADCGWLNCGSMGSVRSARTGFPPCSLPGPWSGREGNSRSMPVYSAVRMAGTCSPRSSTGTSHPSRS